VHLKIGKRHERSLQKEARLVLPPKTMQVFALGLWEKKIRK